MPRWVGQADPAAAAYWAGTDTPGAGHASRTPEGPEINDISQLLDAVALGTAVAYIPVSAADPNRYPELAFVPVTDLSPSQVVATWPDTCRSRAVAGFVRAALKAAAENSERTAALA